MGKKKTLGKKCASLAQQEFYNVNTILAHTTKIHEEGSNLNTVCTSFKSVFVSSYCLLVPIMRNKTYSYTHAHTHT